MKKTIRRGALSVTLTQLGKGVHLGSWKVTHRDASGKVVSGGVLKTLTKAQGRADEILDAMTAEAIHDLTPAEARFIRAVREAGVAVGDLEPALREIEGSARVTVREAAETFWKRREAERAYSYEQGKDYERVLAELKAKFGTDLMTAMRPAAILSWADGWAVGPKRWNNKRTILDLFFRWAVGANIITKNPMAGVPRMGLPQKADHEVWTPKQFAKLLVACPAANIPWLVLGGMAGMRGVEIYGRPDDRESGLRWEQIDWQRKMIVLQRSSAKKTKTAKTRIIPLTDAMADWLSPWKQKSGPVYSPEMPPPHTGSNSMTAHMGEVLGIPWKGNALRASRASYRLADTGCMATVTLEMGHSKDMLMGTYLNPRFADDAKVWFSLDRAAAKALASEPDVIQMEKVG